MARTPATMHSVEWDQIFEAAADNSYWRMDRAKVALRAPHLAGLAMSDVEACTAGSCILPSSPQLGPTLQNFTFLALARAPVCCTEHSDVTLRVLCTSFARGLSGRLLVEAFAEAVAVDAAELSLFGLEVAYRIIQRTTGN